MKDMAMKLHLKMIIKNKKALSMIVSTLILTLLVVSAAAIIWGVVGNMVDDKIEGSESCFNIFGKISINEEYTCYYSNTGIVQFSLEIGDIDVDAVMISIQSESSSRIIEITNTAASIPFLANYNSADFESDLISLPPKNGGNTYAYYEAGIFTTAPSSIKIAPIIGNKVCALSDTLEPIQNC